MKLRDLAFAACRVLGIYVGLQSIHFVSALITNEGLSARQLVAYALPVVLFIAAGITLWVQAAPLADRIAEASVPGAGASGSLGVQQVLVTGLWLLGIFFIASGTVHIARAIGNAIAIPSSGFPGERNPLRDLALWDALASVVEAGAGAYLVVKAKTIADRFGPEADRER